jgi:tmRNA-binding protein
MLKDNPRKHHNNLEEKETRGRKHLISPKEIRELERIMEEEGFEAWVMI